MFQVRTSRAKARNIAERQLFEGFKPAGNCMEPITVTLQGAPDPVLVKHGIEANARHYTDLEVRCRKCEACLRHRAALWTARACTESALAARTWFGTLTFGPDARVRHQYESDRFVQQTRCQPWSALSTSEQFPYLVDSCGKEVTRWLKRVRKNSEARLRYLLVAEAHKDGFPHFHLLLHEVAGTATKRELDNSWRAGFSQFRLVKIGDTKQAWYVCKYLTKTALTRVRASQEYGRLGPYAEALAERYEGIAATLCTAKLAKEKMACQSNDEVAGTAVPGAASPLTSALTKETSHGW